jgi:hypothetical protein
MVKEPHLLNLINDSAPAVLNTGRKLNTRKLILTDWHLGMIEFQRSN